MLRSGFFFRKTRSVMVPRFGIFQDSRITVKALNLRVLLSSIKITSLEFGEQNKLEWIFIVIPIYNFILDSNVLLLKVVTGYNWTKIICLQLSVKSMYLKFVKIRINLYFFIRNNWVYDY